MRILALTRYERLGSSSRVRFYQYFPHLEAQGIEIVNSPFFNDDYVRGLYMGRSVSLQKILYAYLKRLSALVHSARYDLLWVEKELFPWIPPWFETLLHLLRIPYIVDYDDAVFHRYDMHPSAFVRALLGRKIDRVMRHSVLVIAGNDYLAERAKKAGAKRVETLPSVVDVPRYMLKQQDADSPFRIGWIGSPVTAPYLDVIGNALNVLSLEAKIHIVLIGAGNINPFPELPTTRLDWSEDQELSIGETFDVGVMPLVDGPFERGKCGYKLVQYMAGGLPVIASPVGINTQIITPGINGYLAASTDEWLESLRRLINDRELRFKMGQMGRRRAEQMYNLRITAPKLLEMLITARKV